MSVQKIIAVSFDPLKRERTLTERGLDFATRQASSPAGR